MKKILAIALMLCIFTALAVGTAAAKSTVTVKSNQFQATNACGLDAKTCASNIAGTSVVTSDSCFCKKVCIVADSAQTASASACIGKASICQSSNTCVEVCTN
jgi:hypothetical protein